MKSEQETYYVAKRLTGKRNYLEDVWEEWGEDINYSFTDDLSRAMMFSEYFLESNIGAPKYLWDDLNKKVIRSLKEMCEFFNAEMVMVKKTTTWRVCDSND